MNTGVNGRCLCKYVGKVRLIPNIGTTVGISLEPANQHTTGTNQFLFMWTFTSVFTNAQTAVAVGRKSSSTVFDESGFAVSR